MSERDLIDELLQAKVKTTLFGGDHAPRLGRLVILEPLGSGGMGTVFCAYDPRLDRKVAVKLLRGEGASAARVLREARALGKLTHPNVVAVYDATETEGVVSIVMELAPGESLRTWIGADKPWRQVLGVMQQVGAGLAAAHRAGIIHRDIKPDNIMIGPDRARLVDFGLAHAPSLDSTPARESSDTPELDSLEGSGTPSYMAPEVLAGEPANEASDQFNFGVTLFEALYGVRPHRAKRKKELAAAARGAAAATQPAGTQVPSWLHQVVMRSLAADPKARFPSIEALVAELGRDRRRRRRRVLAASGAVALALMVGVIGYHRGASRDVCAGGRERVAAAWPRTTIERLGASLGDAPWAKKAVADFGELTGAWEHSYRRVCEATGVPESLLELRMRCLDRRFDRMTALGNALSGSLDPETRENASAAVAALPRPERCESLVDAGELALPDDPKKRARVQSAEREMDRAWTGYALGHYREAREIANAIEAGTTDLDFPPLRAPLFFLLGSIEARLGDARRARPRLETALREAANAHAGQVELEIWARLLRNELFDGNSLHTIEWAPFARAAASRVGANGAEIDGIVAEARRDAGDLGEARELLTRALASTDELRGDQRALLEMNLGSVELAAGKPSAADAAFVRAFALAETALGKGHPGLGLYIDKLAAVARARGRMGDALARHEQALELRRLMYGDTDRAVATTLLRRAQTRIEAGKLAAAETDLVRARQIRAEIHGPSHRRLGEIDLALGDVAAARGDFTRASELYKRASELDGQINVSARLAEAGIKVDPSALALPKDGAPLSVDVAEVAAVRVDRLRASGDLAQAKREAETLSSHWRDAGDGLSASLSNQVALAQQRVGKNDDAVQAFDAALAALADEPSRERLRALTGLAECAGRDRARQAAVAAVRLLDAMPELDRALRGPLQRIADRP